MGSKRSRQLIVLSDDDDDNNDNDDDAKKPAFTRGLAPVSQSRRKPLPIDAQRHSCPRIPSDEIFRSANNEYEYKELSTQLWVDKYRPGHVSDLAVHNKKIAEVRDWLEVKLNSPWQLHSGSYVLVLVGPTGVGKTAVVRALINLLNAELCEWDPPIPTLWKEHLHQGNTGVAYVSKIQEFIAFLESVKKFPFLSSMQGDHEELNGQPHGHGKRKVLFLDDLPNVQGKEAEKKLCRALHMLALSVQFPTIVIITEFCEEGENGQATSHFLLEVLLALESGGAKKVTFNPITANAIRKALAKILLMERCVVPLDSLAFIAESSGGDIRHAISCLQFCCLVKIPSHNTWDPGGLMHPLPKSKRQRASASADGNQAAAKHLGLALTSSFACKPSVTTMCRDGVLSLFHALGKVLHNKRHKEAAKDSGGGLNFTLIDRLQRHPLNMEAPETVLSQAHTEALKFSLFLFENMLDFFDDEDDGVEDVAIAMSYLSDVDCLLGIKHMVLRSPSHRGPSSDDIDPGHLAEAVAGSLSVRGVLFANTTQGKHRWQSLRAPAVWQFERLMNEKKIELRERSWAAAHQTISMVSKAAQATDYEPYRKRFLSTPGQKHHNVAECLPWADFAEPNSETLEDDEEKTALALSQEDKLSSHMMAIDIQRAADFRFWEPDDCEDEIEDW